MIVFIIGVAGAGKSTLASTLASRLSWVMIEADDYHPPENIAKMRRGEPLDDNDRRPWLDALLSQIVSVVERRGSAVVACSALKQAHRQELREVAGQSLFVLLDADRALATHRLLQRRDHFMSSILVDSQLAALQPPSEGEAVLTLAAGLPVEDLSAAVIDYLSAPDR